MVSKAADTNKVTSPTRNTLSERLGQWNTLTFEPKNNNGQEGHTGDKNRRYFTMFVRVSPLTGRKFFSFLVLIILSKQPPLAQCEETCHV